MISCGQIPSKPPLHSTIKSLSQSESETRPIKDLGAPPSPEDYLYTFTVHHKNAGIFEEKVTPNGSDAQTSIFDCPGGDQAATRGSCLRIESPGGNMNPAAVLTQSLRWVLSLQVQTAQDVVERRQGAPYEGGGNSCHGRLGGRRCWSKGREEDTWGKVGVKSAIRPARRAFYAT